MNAEGIRLLAGAQTQSSQLLSGSAGRLTSAAAEFAPAQAGRDYQAYGKQIQAAMEVIGQQVSSWAVAVEQTASSLALSTTAITGVDGTTAADINAVGGAG
ncbi:hypothetical protein [Nocardia sp. NPDC051463]|uniref:hypothetical protein n=1 Tax=Nocardia sp. NPDC051463 TaxID=3154845 RepID=UPI00343A889E